MLYDDYRRRVTKAAGALNFIKRHRAPIIAVLACIVLAVSALVSVRGIVYDVSDCPSSVTYGKTIGYEAGAVFGAVGYEYAAAGSSEWSETPPVRAGEYEVRARAKGPFGIRRYGKIHGFTILPKEVDVRVSQTEIGYGIRPDVSADLEYGDRIECAKFIYGNLSERETTVTADVEFITVSDASGQDVTSSYVFRPLTSTVGFIRREITVTVRDKSGIYDGEALQFDGYELSGGTPLAAGDRLIAAFEAKRTDVGVTENIPKIRIVREGVNADVTGNYDIRIVPGKLTVEKRPLYVATGSASKIYDGAPLSDGEYEVQTADRDSGLLEGHALSVAEPCRLTDAGKADNLIRFSVSDGAADVTPNYCVFYRPGILEVKPRPLGVVTADESWMYDGTPHQTSAFAVESASDGNSGLLTGHSAVADKPAQITNAGRADNSTTVRILSGSGADVTGNYDISYTFGTLEVEKRPVVLKARSAEWIFDGKAHSETGFDLSEESLYGLAAGNTAKAVSAPSVTECGSTENILEVRAYAADGRDVTANYIFSCEAGTIGITPRPITVYADSAEKIYDGTPLSSNGFLADSPCGFALAEGHTGTAENDGRQTDAGKSANTVKRFFVFQDGRDVTFNYDVTLKTGELKVFPRPITVTADSTDKIYDGEPLSSSDYGLSCAYGPALVAGHTISVEIVGRISDAGECPNTVVGFSVTDGTRDVTFNYEGHFVDGVLTVNRRPIAVETESKQWVYDGEVHYASGVSPASSGAYRLIEGHVLSAVSATFLENAGEAENVLHVFVNENGRDVTMNYDITQIYGTLKVTPRPLHVAAEGGEKVYDGTPLTVRGIAITSPCDPPIVAGQYPYYETGGSQTDVGRGEGFVSLFAVYSSAGADKTQNYEISFASADLVVTKRPVTFRAGSLSAHYDGNVWYSKEVYADAADENSSSGLLSWHDYFAETNGSRTEAGTSENGIVPASLRISEEGRDVTFNYEVTFESGYIKIYPRPVRVIADSAEKMYDGTPLTCSTFTLESELSPVLVEGHEAEAEVGGSQTEIGRSRNELINARIVAGGRDVTHNYELHFVDGMLTVQIPDGRLEIKTCDAEKMYDGIPLTCDRYEVKNTLPDGYIVEVSCVGSITYVGETQNTASLKVTAPGGADVTDYIQTSYEYGALVVYPRPVVIQTNDHVWPYDGRLHYDTGHSVSDAGESLAEGDRTETRLSQTIIDVGMMLNEQEVLIFGKDGQDVTYNYEIKYIFGILEVTESSYEGGGGNLDTSGTFGGGGGDGSGSGGGMDKTAVKVYSETGGMAYLRLMSFGDYNGRKWGKASSYGDVLDGAYCMNYLTGAALENAGINKSSMKIEVTGSDYLLPYYLAPGDDAYGAQMSDVWYRGDTDGIYEVAYYPCDYVINGPFAAVPERYAAAEINYRAYVKANYLAVPGSTRAYLNTVIRKEGFDPKAPNIVAAVAEYIRGAATYNMKFDPALNMESDIVVSFLRDYKQGICQHFASAAAMLYRMLGIPARYTIGYAGEISAGEWTEISYKNAHAWVEVYIDGVGWVQVEVTGGGPVFGGDGEAITELIVKPADEVKKYDGTPLYPQTVVGAGQSAYYFKELLLKGYTYEAEFKGSQTAIGRSVSEIESFTMYAPDGSVATGFRFVYMYGELFVTDQIVAHIRPYSLQKVYDGTPLVYKDGEYTVSGLPSGYKLEFSIGGVGLTDFGMLSKWQITALPVRITDENGQDVTLFIHLDIDTDDALTISRRPLEISTVSETKIYDGTPLRNGGYWISKGSLAAGHTIEVRMSGSLTDIGVKNNTVDDIVIRDAFGADVTKNYDISIICGVLEVVG